MPPRDADPSELWKRFCGLIGTDAQHYAIPDSVRSNESLGIVQIEQLRRVNAIAQQRFNQTQRRQLVRKLYALQVLPQTTPSVRPELPAYALETAQELADEWITEIQRGGYHLVGDLDDLRPGERVGSDPSEVSADDVLTAGAEATVELLSEYAGLQAAQKDEPAPA